MFRWLPRLIIILLILISTLLATDVFREVFIFPHSLIAFLIHLIPTFILALFLLIAWKKEHLGGWLFLILGILYLLISPNRMSLDVYLLITGPLFLAGILFIVSNNFKNK